MANRFFRFRSEFCQSDSIQVNRISMPNLIMRCFVTILAEIYGDPIFFGSGPGFVNRTQSDPGFVNPVRSGSGFVNPVRSHPFLVLLLPVDYHDFQDLLKLSFREKLVSKREFNSTMDKHAVKVAKGDETVGHLPCKFSQIVWNLLACSGEISVEVIGRRQCGRMNGS